MSVESYAIASLGRKIKNNLEWTNVWLFVIAMMLFQINCCHSSSSSDSLLRGEIRDVKNELRGIKEAIKNQPAPRIINEIRNDKVEDEKSRSDILPPENHKP